MSYNVLVVDDSLTMRSVMKKVIRASGLKIAKFFDAANGKVALDILRKEWLDLVVTDYNMPEMDGMELISEMKKDELLKSIPVFVISVEGSQQKRKEFMEKGAAEYLMKPFTLEEAYVGYISDMDIGDFFTDDMTSVLDSVDVFGRGVVELNTGIAWDSNFVESNFEGKPGFVGTFFLQPPGILGTGLITTETE